LTAAAGAHTVTAAVPRLVACIAGLVLLLLAPPAARAQGIEDPFPTPRALAAAADVPEEFVEETAFDDLVAPASIAFAPDGRIFVAQLDGVIKVFDGLDDTSASVYADLSQKVAFHNDRGLLGMTLDPQFTTGRPYVYVTYTYDAAIGQQAPRWNDNCTDPPGAERDGCVVSGRLSKILPDGSEQPLIADEWCQQYPSHSLGDVKFGPDGALYLTAGDGASYTFADYGQDGAPVNPCGDPPLGVGSNLTPPTAEGGALRSQDVRTTGDPTGLNGTLMRVDPDTGAPLPDNPGTGDVNARRIIAYGFRNPFRFAFRPGTTDAYVGDVGWIAWEELNRVPDPAQVRNYGWPCYEGAGRQGAYEALGLNLCRDLYAQGGSAVVPPLYAYNHIAKVTTENCPIGSSSVSGVTFYDGTSFPVAYNGAMFWADYARNCIWVMFPNADGTPNPATRQVFVDGARSPVDLEIGPGGDLYYADVTGGTIRRIRAINPNEAPTAAFAADPITGEAPLEVHFDAGESSDPNGDALAYAWDLDGDGAFDDSTSETPTRTYTADGQFTVKLRVTDPGGLADTEEREITIGTPPQASITSPAQGSRYAVGEEVVFAGAATDGDGSPLSGAAMVWTVDLHHCSALVPTNCHVHHIRDFVGVDGGTLSYPDHEYPSYVVLGLTVTGQTGLRTRTSLRIDPKTVDLTFNSVPSGLTVAVGGEAAATPFTRTVAQGSTVGVAAPPNQFHEGRSYDFSAWSDGGAAAHQITAPADASAYTVTYAEAVCPQRPGLVGAWGFDETSGTTVFDSSGRENTGTVSGASRTTGRFGSALNFDGTNDLVTIPDSSSLDLTNGVTLEAWVNPTTIAGSWRTVAIKEQPGDLVYALYAGNGQGLAAGHVSTPFEFRVGGPSLPVNAWSHLAMTYDGAALRLYIDGAQVGTLPVVGALTLSNGALRIGGNTVWSEWFAGRIDELRVYDRALAPVELQVDRERPVTCSADPDAPALSVSPAAVSFSGERGAASPAPKTVNVANTGAGPMTWTADEDAAWLSVAPDNGSGAGTLTLTPDTSGLTAGTYTANLTVTAPGASGSPRIVPVSLTVTPPPPGPELSVSPSSLSFTATEGGASPADRTLDVSNSGGGSLAWTVAVDEEWLSVSPAGGTGAGEITVSASTAGLSAGTHTANVTVSAPGASGAPRTIPVSFTIEPPPPPPTLVVAPAALNFSAVQGAATVETKAINVTNGGGGTLAFTAVADVPWLNVSPASGSAPRTVSVTPSTAGLSPGVHTGAVTVTSAGVEGSPRIVPVTFVVTEPPVCPIPTGLVGAWGFDEASGTAVTDASPAGNDGTLSGAARAAIGRHGRALSFDGVNDWVTVPDAGSLDLTTAMTASAWVNPAALGSSWRTVLMKEAVGTGSYSLYANTNTPQAGGYVSTPFESGTKSPGALAIGVWTHLATTYDGATLRMFVNGVEVSSRALLGSILVGTGPLRIGGNSLWSEWFSGLIDEVRLYNRPLSAAEVQADMISPVTCSGPPALSVTPSTLGFDATEGGSDPAAKTLAVTAGGLSFTASESAPWLALSTTGGTVTATPSIEGLSAGTYTTDITVTAPGASGSPKTIPVTLTVAPPPPELTVTPASLAFSATQGSASPDAKTLDVAAGSLSFTASEGVAWLSLSTSGATVTVTPSITGLAPGTYTTNVTVSASGATGSPKTVPVTLTVAPAPPSLSVTPASLSFSGAEGGLNPAAQTLSVANSGGGSLDWSAGEDADWLSLTPTAGSDAGTIIVTPSLAGLTEGTYTADITVTAPGAGGSPQTIPVTFTVGPPAPELTVTPASLAFAGTQGGASPQAKTLEVTAGPLSFSASETVPWLSLATSGGTVTVTPSITGLTAGTYTTDITVTAPGADGSPRTVPVTFTVAPPPPVLSTAPASLSFTAAEGGANPPAQNVSVTNGGGGTLDFSAADDAGWLSVSPSSGSAPATLSVSPIVSGLAAGTYTGAVTVTADGVSGSPKTVTVTLTVNPPPAHPPGLVAAWGFEETSGTTVTDVSGGGHTGTISGAARSTSGRFGRALSFDGVNDWVTVPDANTLDLTTGLTMSAWVNPTALGTMWRTVLIKEQPGGLIYALYAGNGTSKPAGHVFTTAELRASGPANTAPNTWTHLAVTWNGTTIRTFVNGAEVASAPAPGVVRTSTGALRIGGTAVWTEWFSGLIDEVRLYGRALTPAEIQGDMTRPVS
jgi:glucose/arabinose dehydrogenase